MTSLDPLPTSYPLLVAFEEILEIATRKVLADTMQDSDRVSLYQLALALVADNILVDEELVARIHPEVLAALHQLALLADPSTTAETLNTFAASLDS